MSYSTFSKPPTGRFAPSPTGDLHLGSLVAATASYLNVKQRQGNWLVRIDDIDAPRVVSGSQETICRQLESYGFEWDKLIIQSQRLSYYQDALSDLTQLELVYQCDCTRKQIQQRLQQSGLYDNFCRHRQLASQANQSVRVVTPETPWRWHDTIQGDRSFDWQSQSGDFIVKRADDIFAYHLVAAIDDSDEGITEVIRGADLLSATAPQQYLQQCLKRPIPIYAHHPLMRDAQSQIKLSKATHAPAITAFDAVKNLWQVLSFLNQHPPSDLQTATLHEVWQWAIENWSLEKINPSTERD